MSNYLHMSNDQLAQELSAQMAHLTDCRNQNMNLNMARGKPEKQQLDAVSDILSVITSGEDCFEVNLDTRNYGELVGIPSARAYWADVLGCKPEQTFIGGSASLNLMYDVIAKAYSHGLLHSPRPWCKEEQIKFLCPSPGYDRHFRITETFGAELIVIPMRDDGPDMDMIEEYVKDPQVKGVWCVPKYSNPEGIIYSDDVIRRFAALKPAAPDFTIMWDNAYFIHEFEGEFVPFLDIISLCEEAGNPDMVYEFASTSKITFAGAGFSVMASSVANIAYQMKLIGVQTISYDKVNQLRHVKYLKNKEHTIEIMKRHAAFMAPKFAVVSDLLEKDIKPCGIARWNRPKGGYFVSLYAMEGTAKRTLALCKECGLEMTPAGATYPHGNDPHDSNIRIAPSYPTVEELVKAMDIFCTCLKVAALEKLMNV